MPYIKPVKETYKEHKQTYLKQMNLQQKDVSYTNEYSKDKAKYYNSKGWKTLRQQKLLDQPLCELCMVRGMTKPAQEVHHGIKFYDQLDDNMKKMLLLDYDNLVSVCKSCHKHIHYQQDQFLWPEQRQYLYNLKNRVSQKYFDQGVLIRWTNDDNVKTRKF